MRSFNRGGTFYKYNTGGKKSITVNARHPDGLALLKRLVAVSDVVTESFAAGTMARWGLAYEELRRCRPDVIYVSMCGFGHEGPDSHYVTMGPTAQALTGLTFLVGLPDRPPAGWSFSYLDHVGGYLGALAVVQALHHRRTTGAGQHVDVSQLEPATALNGALLLDFLVNQRPARRPGFPPGNRRLHPPAAPQGAYRAAGDDRWIVISCRTEQHWQGLVQALGRPRWAQQERFATAPRRLEHRDELDAQLEGWTQQHDRYDAMELLQAHGVPAGAVQDAADRVERDPQLAARGHFTRLRSREVGELPLEGLPLRMSATPPHTGGSIHRGPPDLGEDTDTVLRELLDLDDSQLARLHAEKVLA
jgi:crotonobetainyl-CoA:carnitine CoA-transferase CaiB-like acyl-CoA transferase